MCSLNENVEFFQATIGVLGLTGLVLWADIQLKRISTAQIDRESILYGNLDEFFDIAASSDRHFEYTVAWITCFANGRQLGRGIFLRGNHREAPRDTGAKISQKPRKRLTVPCAAPNVLLNRLTMKAFNLAYYHSHYSKHRAGVVDFRFWNQLTADLMTCSIQPMAE